MEGCERDKIERKKETNSIRSRKNITRIKSSSGNHRKYKDAARTD
jgi:hypothetical protein